MRPLEGIRILDLGRLIPGPYATMVLGDLGATVDKVEEIDGDPIRQWYPRRGNESALFLALNRNKRSICLDLKKEEGRVAFRALARRADVLFDPFRPGVLDRLGLGHASLREGNPRLVVCAFSSFGQDGPLAQRTAHELAYLARAGLLGDPTGSVAPEIPYCSLAGIGGAIWCVVGILAALAERARTGVGRIVDISITEAAMGFTTPSLGALLADDESGKHGLDVSGGTCAPYQIYTTKDGRHIALSAPERKSWMAFCESVGLPGDLSALEPGPHQEALRNRLDTLFASRTFEEWRAFCANADCCLEPIAFPRELPDDPQHRARHFFFELPSPWGPLLQFATPVTDRGAAHSFSHTPPPRAGEHTEMILREAGFSPDQIATMRAQRIIA
ncbi:CoA transferase [Pendulispora brunnea]|uniref:CoA transferase n=1 Tax=Pendulispora brunnea TaxID=2905690 RepID=A0ABZ2JWM7_9BACT